MIHTDGTPTIANRREPAPSGRDFHIERQGNIFLVTPQNRAARTWLADNVDLGEAQFHGFALCVDQHRVEDLFDGIVDSGFTVS